MTSDEGRFASPSYPNGYPDSAECVWVIGGSPGNRVRMNLIEFDVEESESCNMDYLEVHSGSEEGPLLGHFCGSQVPGQVLEAERLWIKFNSDVSGSRSGFLAYYSLGEVLRQKT